MSICSYCCSQSPTDFLTCCLTLSCNLCLSKHDCNSIDTLPLELKQPILKTCRRCNISCITHKCTTCKKFYCKQCKDDIHVGKFLTHEIVEIGQLKNFFSDQITCSRHNIKRNIVLQNGQVGCIRCSDEDGLKKASILQQNMNKNIKQQSSLLKQIFCQKKQSLNYQRSISIQKWNSVQQNIKNIFKKLSMQLQDRLQVTLQKVHHIRSTQLLVFDQLLNIINIQSNSLESLKTINLNNKNKFMKLKYGSIQEILKIIQRKKKVGQYHIGRMETQSLISAIKGLVSIDKVKQQFQSQRKRSDLMDSRKKDNRRSQSRDKEMSRSRVSQVNLQSGMKTRQNSMTKLPIANSFQKKLTESILISTQKSRLKNEVMTPWKLPQQPKKIQQENDKFKNNFLQMKQNIRKSGTYFTQRNTTKR